MLRTPKTLPTVTPTTSDWQMVLKAPKRTMTTQNTIQSPTHKPRTQYTKMEINQFHSIAGHVNERFLRKTAEHYREILYGQLKPCVHCSLANISKASTSKETIPRCEVPGERIYIDISKFTHPSLTGSKFWLLVVDDATDYTWSFFLKKKSETTDKMLGFLKSMVNRGSPVHRIRCDNSGENNFLQSTLRDQGSAISFEYTSPGTPQQNGRVERKIAIMYQYMRSMISQAKLPANLRKRFWAEAAHHATDVINGMCTSQNTEPPYKQFYGQTPNYFLHLRPFGDVAVVRNVHKQLKAKDMNCGLLGIYLGRAVHHISIQHDSINLTQTM
jgi:hypothetical protein